MNRRTFIKTTGMISLLGMTNLVFAEREQQWIRMNKRMPEIGQNIIMLAYCVPHHIKNVPESIDHTSLFFAKRIEDFYPLVYHSFRVKYLYSNSFYNCEGDKTYELHYNSDSYSKEDIKRIDKMCNVIGKKQGELRYVPHSGKETKFWLKIWHWANINIHDNMYWISADKYYSKDLPELPKPVY